MKKNILLQLVAVLLVAVFFHSCKKDNPGNGGGGGSTVTGQAIFWTQTDLGCGNITVEINGTSKVITNYFPGGAPSCSAGGAATFTLEPGVYNYSASCSGLTWSGIVTVLANNCSKIELVSGGGTGGGGGGSSTGQAMFWIGSDLGCGNITVNCNGQTRTISSYYSSGTPACAASGTATFSFAPGTYSYTASCSGLNWNGTVTITAGGCSKIQLTNSGGGGGGGGSSTGQALFWIASDLGCGSITVNCNGQTRTITSYYSSGAPACGASGAATFSFAPGTYSYTASCSGSTWNGTVTITAGGCSKIQLTSSGGGGGGGGTTGQVMFWTATNWGCGTITVNCNGQSRTITSYYTGGAPSACGASGCATFAFAPGTYSFSASCSGRTWNGTVTVTSGGCMKMQLT